MKALILTAFLTLQACAISTPPLMSLSDVCVVEITKQIDVIMLSRTEFGDTREYVKSINSNDELVDLLYDMKRWEDVNDFKQIVIHTCRS